MDLFSTLEDIILPVHPAVIIPMNCAQNIDNANGMLYPPMKKEIIAVTKPIAIPEEYKLYSRINANV